MILECKQLSAALVLAGVLLLIWSVQIDTREYGLFHDNHTDIAAALAEARRPKAWYEPLANHPLAVLGGICVVAGICMGIQAKAA